MIRTTKEWIEDPRTRLVDLMEADPVELVVDHTGKLWLNVDSVCVVRIGLVREASCQGKTTKVILT